MMLQLRRAPVPASGGGGGGGFPDLQALYGVPWNPTWPTAPTTSSSTTVNNATQWNAASKTGNRITVAAGSYGDIALDGLTDCEVIFQSNVTWGAMDIGNIQRVILRFETPRDVTSTIQYLNCGSAFNSPISNLLLNGIRTYDPSSISHSCHFTGNNSAMINSYLQTNSYGIFSDQGSQGRPTNMTFYNNTVDSGNVNGGGTPQSLFRFTGCERMVMCRNRLIKVNDGQMGRVYSKSDTWVSHNQFEATGGWNNPGGSWSSNNSDDAGTPVNTTYRVRVVSNVVYNNGGGAGGLVNDPAGMSSTSNEYLFQDNVGYCSTDWPTVGPSGVYTFTNNTRNPYTSPAAWSFA